mmetsp:Transcript_86274/g.230412  ORF Transcript_86274/g.230412 Transcript_86274/m.230412 type:complete len:103 (+) Transcript_86274:1032-1340(+)
MSVWRRTGWAPHHDKPNENVDVRLPGPNPTMAAGADMEGSRPKKNGFGQLKRVFEGGRVRVRGWKHDERGGADKESESRARLVRSTFGRVWFDLGFYSKMAK